MLKISLHVSGFSTSCRPYISRPLLGIRTLFSVVSSSAHHHHHLLLLLRVSCEVLDFYDMSSVEKIQTEAAFYQALRKKPICVMYFGATWCGPCKRYAPRYAELAGRCPDVQFCKIDADELRSVVQAVGVKAFPTTAIYLNSEKQETVVGGDIGAVSTVITSLRSRAFRAFEGDGHTLNQGGAAATQEVSPAAARKIRLRRLEWAKAEAVAASKTAAARAVAHPEKVSKLVAVLANIDRALAAPGGRSALNIVHKIVCNLIANPNEPKYSSINTSGKTYQKIVAPVKEANELLMRLGFRGSTSDDGGSRRLVLDASKRDGKILAACHAKLQSDY